MELVALIRTTPQGIKSKCCWVGSYLRFTKISLERIDKLHQVLGSNFTQGIVQSHFGDVDGQESNLG